VCECGSKGRVLFTVILVVVIMVMFMDNYELFASISVMVSMLMFMDDDDLSAPRLRRIQSSSSETWGCLITVIILRNGQGFYVAE
jgi:hypothetical protein